MGRAKRAKESRGTSSPQISHILHKRQLEDVVNSILYDRMPQVTGKDGRNALAIVMALYKSCKSGKPEKVDAI